MLHLVNGDQTYGTLAGGCPPMGFSASGLKFDGLCYLHTHH